jgi:hypothetical protein
MTTRSNILADDEHLLSTWSREREQIKPDSKNSDHNKLLEECQKMLTRVVTYSSHGNTYYNIDTDKLLTFVQLLINTLLERCFGILNEHRQDHCAFKYEIYEPKIGKLSKKLNDKFFWNDALKSNIAFNLVLKDRRGSMDATDILTTILTQWDATCKSVGEEYSEEYSEECGEKN